MDEVNKIRNSITPHYVAEGIGSPLRGQVRSLYFIGIGGIGMSAIARYYNTQKVRVSGYDKTVTTLTQQLEAEGIDIHYEEDVALIPKDVDLVVYTPAIPADNAELQYYQHNNYHVVKRSDVLKIITESSFNICVAGTHGKTTVSTMVAHILRHSGFGCNAFLGGISANYGTNFWSNEKNVCVIEADEYDRSFLKLSPDVAVITSMDADHLDIYGTAVEFENAFIEFSKKLKKGGCLLSKYGVSKGNDLTAGTHFTYSLEDAKADVF
ncbi:MAG TPA: Mur ligase domain-containing protein, partial [Segetibacter sp.]